MVLFFGLMAYLLYPSKEPIKNVKPIVAPVTVEKTIESDIIIKDDKNTNNFDMELLNDIDTMRGLTQEAEMQTERLTYKLELNNLENEKLKNQIEELIVENEKLKNQIPELENKLENMATRIIETPSDEFIYYLGDITYKRCKNTLNQEILRKCARKQSLTVLNLF